MTVNTPRTAIAINEPIAKLLPGVAALTAQAKAPSRTPRPAGKTTTGHGRVHGDHRADHRAEGEEEDDRAAEHAHELRGLLGLLLEVADLAHDLHVELLVGLERGLDGVELALRLEHGRHGLDATLAAEGGAGHVICYF
jgi:hypothetical protein